MKKSLSLVLAIIIVSSTILIWTNGTASAAIALRRDDYPKLSANSKTLIAAYQELYDLFYDFTSLNLQSSHSLAYMTTTGKPCSHSATSTCNNCELNHITTAMQSKGLIDSNFSRRGDAWTCYAFCELGLRFLYGNFGSLTTVSTLNNPSTGDIKNFFQTNLKLGDVIQMRGLVGGVEQGLHWYFYISQTDSTIKLLDANNGHYGYFAVGYNDQAYTSSDFTSSKYTAIRIYRPSANFLSKYSDAGSGGSSTPATPISSISLTGRTHYLDVGSSIDLTATISPSNATNKTLTWKSGATSIATVSNGKVTGVAPGDTIITATNTASGKSATFPVHVVKVTNTMTASTYLSYWPFPRTCGIVSPKSTSGAQIWVLPTSVSINGTQTGKKNGMMTKATPILAEGVNHAGNTWYQIEAGFVYSGDVNFTERDHSWAWTKGDAQNCKGVCSICHAEDTMAHRWGSWTKVDATNHKRFCSVCGAAETANHSWGSWTKVDANNHKRTCSGCGATETAAHSYTYVENPKPTLTTTGTITGTCSTCKNVITATFPVISEKDYVRTVYQEPTYSAKGYSKYTWKNTTYGDRHFVIQDIPALKAVTKITLNNTEITVCKGQEFTLTATAAPSDATNTGVHWKTSNANVATRNYNTQIVHANGIGDAVFTAEADDGQGASATCIVHVVDHDWGEESLVKFNMVKNCNRSGCTATESRTFIDKDTSADVYFQYYPFNACNGIVTPKVGVENKIFTLPASFIENGVQTGHTNGSVTGQKRVIAQGRNPWNNLWYQLEDGFVYSGEVNFIGFEMNSPEAWYTWASFSGKILNPNKMDIKYIGLFFDTNSLDNVEPLNVSGLLNDVYGVTGYYECNTNSTEIPLSMDTENPINFPLNSGTTYNVRYFVITSDDKIFLSPQTDSFSTIVRKASSIDLQADKTTLCVGENLTINATVNPDDTTDTSLTWSSSDYRVVSVNQYGRISAVSTGKAIITATVNDGSGVSAAYSVEVVTHPVNSTVTKAPTLDSEGTLSGTCSNCGKTMIATLPKLDTENYSMVITVEPTTSEKGTAEYTLVDKTYGSVVISVELPRLTALTLPSSLTRIEAEAFSNVSADVIVIPANVKTIDELAFANCPNLRYLVFQGNPTTIASNILDGCGNVTIRCTSGGYVARWAANMGYTVEEQ